MPPSVNAVKGGGKIVMIESYSTDITRKASAAELVGCRDEAIRLYQEAFRLIYEAKKMAIRATGSDYAGPNLRSMTFYSIEKGDCKDAMKEVVQTVDAGCWEYMLDALGLKNMMDATELEKFRKQNKEAPAPVTMDNLAATMNDLSSRRVEIFDQGVINLFSKLDHTFKTNPSFRLEKKIILNGVLRCDGYLSGWAYYRDGQAQVRDLDRIFHLLDGKQPKDHLADAAAVVGAARRYPETVETDYFSFKLFKNGNLHITLKRPDLVESVNRIIAEHFGTVIGHDRRKRKAA